ncbi:class I SAM-dependent methyltransferase [Streptomyces sp. NPDC059909]|uniref:class I SAM-dependent methyltransferase n=1 Tax=Streptomyces sp. NPDC059909 TaxID=3346998 RepID=UPI00364E1C3D
MYSLPPADWREAHRSRWDVGAPPMSEGLRGSVPIHVSGDFHDLDAFRAGKDSLRDFETAEVGDVTGRSLLHLQCHIGLDTLSWSRRGASSVVGLDFSEPAVDAARSLAADLGLGPDRAAFVAAEAVPDTSYDIVYTGVGALNRLPDLTRWAETAAALVAPGGFLYLAEFHPLTDGLDDATGSRITYDYFARDAWVDETPGTYADFDAPTVHNRSVEWQRPVGEVVSAVAAAGLRIEFLHEHDVSLFERLGSLTRHEDGYHRFPAERPRIPLMYSLKATKPSA